MNPRFKIEDAARLQRHVRLAMQNQESDPSKPPRYGLTVMQAYEIEERRLYRQVIGHPPGFFVNARNELKPITAPKPRTTDFKDAATGRKLLPVGIESLAEADGDVDEAETHEQEFERARAAEFSASLKSSGDEAEIENPESREDANEEGDAEDGVEEGEVV